MKHLFTDGVDTVIAEDEKGADDAWAWYTGDPHNSDDYPWKQIPDDNPVTVYFDDEVKTERLPEGAVQVFDDDDMLDHAYGYNWKVTAKASAWAASWNDDFLCSTEV